MKRRTTLAATLLLALSPFARADNSATTQPTTTAPSTFTIPFEILPTGHIAIQVKVNNTGPWRMIFDTGCPSILFSGTASKAAGLIPATAKPLLLGAYVTPPKPATVDIGAFHEEGLVPQVMDHPTVADLAQVVGPLDGLVGVAIFNPDKITIDYHARTLTLVVKPTHHVFSQADSTAILNLLQQTHEVAAPAALWGLSVDKPATDKGPGITITTVHPNSPASRAGLLPNDRLLTLAHRWTDSLEDTYLALTKIPPNHPVPLEILRAGKTLSLTITPTAGL